MKKIIAVIIIILLLITIKNLVVEIRQTSGTSKVTKTLTAELEMKKRQEELLTQKLVIVKSDEFVEQEAREKLGLIKKGEQIVIAPEAKKQDKIAEITKSLPNWKKWWNLFF